MLSFWEDCDVAGTEREVTGKVVGEAEVVGEDVEEMSGVSDAWRVSRVVQMDMKAAIWGSGTVR